MEGVSTANDPYPDYSDAIGRLQAICANEGNDEVDFLLETITNYTNNLHDQLQKKDAEIDAYNYMVSHDLRTPLRAAEIFSGMLSENCKEGLNEEGHKYLSNVQSSLQQMNNFINGLLEYSRAGRKELSVTTVSMKDVFGDAYQFLLFSEPGKSIEFHISDLPPVIADETMIKQLAQHLL